MTRVVAAILRDAGDPPLFFVARRAHGTYAGTWEFPGGKVEEGEGDEAALRRELVEEGIVRDQEDVCVGRLVSWTVLRRGDADYELRHYAVKVRLANVEPPAEGASHVTFLWASWSWITARPPEELSPGMCYLAARYDKEPIP